MSGASTKIGGRQSASPVEEGVSEKAGAAPLGSQKGRSRFHGKDDDEKRVGLRGDRRRNVLHLADVTEEEGSIIYVLRRPLSLHPTERRGREGRTSKHLFCLACKNIHYSQKP